MPGRSIDIKEPETKLILSESGLEIGGIVDYTISRQPGSVGQDFTVVLPKVGSAIKVGERVRFRDIDGIVTSKQNRATPTGYATVVNGVSLIGDLIRKAPLKTLMYMSLTQEERDEFDVACDGDYSTLDYIPLIKICDSQTFIGGWNSQDVINDLLVRKAGFDIVCNVYNFWLKQVNASNTSSYFETAMSLIGFLKPIVYEQDGIIFILDRPNQNGSVKMNRMRELSQRQVFNFDSKAKYFRVTGGYGRWIREKSKIKVEPERETELITETYQEKPMIMTVNLSGNTEKTVTNTTQSDQKFKDYLGNDVVVKPGETTTYRAPDSNIIWKIEGRQGRKEESNLQVTTWLKEPMREKYTVNEVYRLDPFGNFKALISRRKKAFNETLAAVVLDEIEESTYDFLVEEFDRPRLMTRKKTVGKYAWRVTQGLVNRREFTGKAEEISESWAYSANGTLLQETVTKSMDCVKLWNGSEYVTLDMADKFYREEGSPDTVDIERMVVEEQITLYRQVTPDLYEKSTTIRRLGPLSRQKGQENYSATSAMIRGKVPRCPRSYRKMIIEYDNIPDGLVHESIEVPVLTISNPNIIDWSDAEAIFYRLKQQAAESNVTERVLSIPGDILIDIGWMIDLPSVPVGRKLERPAPGAPYQSEDQAIPEVTGPNYVQVVAYEKRKSAGQPFAETVITVEAR